MKQYLVAITSLIIICFIVIFNFARISSEPVETNNNQVFRTTAPMQTQAPLPKNLDTPVARDAIREQDVYTISNAIARFYSTSGMVFPDHDGNDSLISLPKVETCIGTAPECFDLKTASSENQKLLEYVSNPDSFPPKDPLNGTDENTGYKIYIKSSGVFYVTANPETASVIEVYR